MYQAGNFLVCSDRLVSLAMAGVNTRAWAHDFSNEHGRTSSGDDLDGMLDNSFRTSSAVTGSNEDSYGPRCWRTSNVRGIYDCSAAEMSWMHLTLSTKNWQNVETSCTHWASSYTTLCLLCNCLCAVRHVAQTSPTAVMVTVSCRQHSTVCKIGVKNGCWSWIF